MLSSLGTQVQFSPATAREGCCRQKSLWVDSTHRVLATLGLPRTGVSVLSPSTPLRLPAALYGAGPALSAVPVFGSSTKARIWLPLRFVSSPASAVQAARGLGALSPGKGAPFPSAASGSGSHGLGHTFPRCGAPFPSVAGSSGSQKLGRPLPGCCAPFPSAASGLGSQRLGALSPAVACLFPPWPQRTPQVWCLRLAFVQRSWPLAATLSAVDVNHSESQESFR